MEHKPPKILISPAWEKAFENMNDTEVATIIRDIFQYYNGEEIENFCSEKAEFFFNSVVLPEIEQDAITYRKKCQREWAKTHKGMNKEIEE